MIVSEKCSYDRNKHESIINSFTSKDPVISQLYNYKAFLFRNSHINHFTISLDATASMIQILGLLVNDRKLLELTYVIESSEPLDLYDYILSKSPTSPDRTFVKSCIMKYIYGSNPHNLAKSLKSYSNKIH